MSPSTEHTVSLAELADRFSVSAAPLMQVAERYPFRISRYYAELIHAPGDPIWLQAVPDLAELEDDGQLPDPLDEERLSPVPGLIHRYPDRAVLLVSNRCAVYCRFCMRKRQVGCGAATFDLDAALSYLRATPAITDLLLSGGDPLLLPFEQLRSILGALRAIPHLQMIRIGSRVPVTDPGLITPEICRMLAAHGPLYLNTHFNHPRELTDQAAAACALLADAGIVLGNQTVLLRGVNDDATVCAELCRGLLRMRVRPYYLHQMDLVKGTAHFRTGLATGMGLVEGLRGQVSGLAIPHFVVDLPGGKGKVPLARSAATVTEDGWRIRTCSGETVPYRDPV